MDEFEKDVPIVDDFWAGVRAEKEHQLRRWGRTHDECKTPADWFWLLGYLGGKALAAAIAGNREKALHHCISSAAVLANWHEALSRDGEPSLNVEHAPSQVRALPEASTNEGFSVRRSGGTWGRWRVVGPLRATEADALGDLDVVFARALDKSTATGRLSDNEASTPTHDPVLSAEPARLDPDGMAKPKTEIVAVMPVDGDREHTIHAGQATRYLVRPTEHDPYRERKLSSGEPRPSEVAPPLGVLNALRALVLMHDEGYTASVARILGGDYEYERHAHGGPGMAKVAYAKAREALADAESPRIALQKLQARARAVWDAALQVANDPSMHLVPTTLLRDLDRAIGDQDSADR